MEEIRDIKLVLEFLDRRIRECYGTRSTRPLRYDTYVLKRKKLREQYDKLLELEVTKI